MVGETEEKEGEEERSPSPPESRARVRDRVEHIVNLMRSLTWRPSMAEDLAEDWGCAVSTVQNYSAEASRVASRDVPSDSGFRLGLTESAIRIAKACEENGDPKHALVALRLLADLGGHLAPTKTKTELSGPDGGPIQTAGVVVLPPIDPEGE